MDNSKLIEIIDRRLRELDLSERAACLRGGLSVDAIRSIRRGFAPKVNTLSALAIVLQVPMSELVRVTPKVSDRAAWRPLLIDLEPNEEVPEQAAPEQEEELRIRASIMLPHSLLNSLKEAAAKNGRSLSGEARVRLRKSFEQEVKKESEQGTNSSNQGVSDAFKGMVRGFLELFEPRDDDLLREARLLSLMQETMSSSDELRELLGKPLEPDASYRTKLTKKQRDIDLLKQKRRQGLIEKQQQLNEELDALRARLDALADEGKKSSPSKEDE